LPGRIVTKTEDIVKEIIAVSANENSLSKMDKENFLNDIAGGVVDRVRETLKERAFKRPMQQQ